MEKLVKNDQPIEIDQQNNTIKRYTKHWIAFMSVLATLAGAETGNAIASKLESPQVYPQSAPIIILTTREQNKISRKVAVCMRAELKDQEDQGCSQD